MIIQLLLRNGVIIYQKLLTSHIVMST